MAVNRSRVLKSLRAIEAVFLLLVASLFYLLILSRTGEARTVWQVLHPAFMPTLVVATSLLFVILFSDEKSARKLLLIIVFSILVHSLFSIIFPAGDNSGQQMYLGKTRLIYDNVVVHGWAPGPKDTIQSILYDWFNGINFQAALSTIFSRVFYIDVLWVHLFLVPVLWGVFTTVATYAVAMALTQNEKTSVFSALLLSAFPYATYYGAISVPNSLGFIFFFFSLFFMLKYLSANDTKTTALMVAFSFLSFLAHYLTGIVAISLLQLAVAYKIYISERPQPAMLRVMLLISSILAISLLPLSFIYLRLVRFVPTTFTLDKFYKLPIQEIVGLFFLGEIMYSFEGRTAFLFLIGPMIALVYMICLFIRSKRSGLMLKPQTTFWVMAFFLTLLDYRILKVFMEELPLNEERLWVFSDFLAAPFAAWAIFGVYSSLKSKFPSNITIADLKTLSRGSSVRILVLLLSINVIIPLGLGGWVASSLTVAYPQTAPLQTTWYELAAVRHIEETTHERYVVIGDVWTIFAGEVIVGINNPRAYYFREFNKTGTELFTNMTENPSPEWLVLAMSYTNTTVAYFVVTKSRLGLEKFNSVVSSALQNQQLIDVTIPTVSNELLHVFSHKMEENV